MIGVLALQGGFAAHQAHLERLGVPHCQVRKPSELDQLDGIIIPGGESSALLKLMAPWDWLEALRDFGRRGKLIFGTCAGMILLAKQVDPCQSSLGLIDIAVARNAYGRQIDSFIQTLAVKSPERLSAPTLEAVFIRAPKIVQLGAGVEVLVEHQQQPVMVQQDNIIVASFHPELSDDLTVHRYVVACAKATGKVENGDLCLS